jgi:hypothetical protein
VVANVCLFCIYSGWVKNSVFAYKITRCQRKPSFCLNRRPIFIVMAAIFWNATERRVRAGWRICIYSLLWLYGPAAINALVADSLTLPLYDVFPMLATLIPHALGVLARLLVGLVGAWLAARWLDRRPLAEWGLHLDRAWWADLGFGLGLGAFLMTLIFLVEWLAGWVTITQWWLVTLPGISFGAAVLGALFLFLVVSVTEELLFRGYHLRNIAEWVHYPEVGAIQSLVLAWVISSVLFGLLHVLNPNATWYSTLGLVWAGLFLGLGYILTGRLAISIGLHITWNFFQGNVYGFPVSGVNYVGATMIAIRQEGPTVWTGGAFGPEAGLISVIAILIGCGFIMAWVRWRDDRFALATTLAAYQPKST